MPRGRSRSRSRSRGRSSSRKVRFRKKARQSDKLAGPPLIIFREVSKLGNVVTPPNWSTKVRCTYDKGGWSTFSAENSKKLKLEVVNVSPANIVNAITNSDRAALNRIYSGMQIHGFKAYMPPYLASKEQILDDDNEVTQVAQPQIVSGWQAIRVYVGHSYDLVWNEDEKRSDPKLTSETIITSGQQACARGSIAMARFEWGPKDQQFVFPIGEADYRVLLIYPTDYWSEFTTSPEDPSDFLNEVLTRHYIENLIIDFYVTFRGDIVNIPNEPSTTSQLKSMFRKPVEPLSKVTTTTESIVDVSEEDLKLQRPSRPRMKEQCKSS